ncbi:MAG TPA: glycoside hydrolase N-terminal domain-containing protein [Phycisphaerae bacterium]|nr:glycoside hydrolase N-terminal domain-containing protein [Phycisphaerae bacterium]
MHRQSRILALLLAAALASRAHAAEPGLFKTQLPARGVVSNSFAPSWTSAFVTGNGSIGAMVMGAGAGSPPRPNEDSIFFSHAGLFVPMGGKQVLPDLSKALPAMRTTIKTKGYGPALMATYAAAQKQNFPGLTYTDPFLPAFELKLKMPSAGTPRDYLRSENFQTGEVAIHWTDDAGGFTRQLFISRANNTAVLSITSDKPDTPVSCDLAIPAIPNIPVRTYLQNNPNASPGDAAANSLISAATDLDPAGIALRAIFREGKGAGYDAALRVVAPGGTIAPADGGLAVKNAKSILVLLRLEPFLQPVSDSHHALRKTLDDLPADYAALLKPHQELHQPQFDRVSLNLNGGADRALATDELIARANRDKDLPPALLEKIYDASRYALLCASATPGAPSLPPPSPPPATPCTPNLQNLWAGHWAPGFTLAGDYAFDISYQLSVASALSCNSPQLLAGTFRLADASVADWQLNAKNLFGARGILVPAHQSSSGLNLQWSDRSPGPLLWTAGAGIMAHWYYDYFLYTGDEKFLAAQAVPFMKQVAAFYEDFLFIDATGKYRFSPSYSPDDAPGDNSTMDIMVAKEVLTNLIAACKRLHIEAANIDRWQGMLDRMPAYLIAENGELQEWALPNVTNKSIHRHIPHLYAVYMSHELDPEKTPELWNAAYVAFQSRLAQWFKPETRPGEMNPQPIQDRLLMGLCAARFGDAAAVNDILTRVASRNVYPSLLTQRYEDNYTLVSDGNAIPEILNSALLYSQPGRIDLLPALPASIPAGEIRGLAARSLVAPITVTRLAWDKAEIQVELVSSGDQSLEIRIPKSAGRTVQLRAGTPLALTFPRL